MKVQSVKNLILTALFASLTAVGAFIRIPMWPVAFSLQFMMTAFAGLMLGARLGATSQAVYLLIGLLGAPVFTEGGGIAYVIRPSFGFLVGLIPAAYVIGRISHKSENVIGHIVSCLAGLGVLYAVGVPYMYMALRVFAGTDISIKNAITSGMLVFLPGDLIKTAVCSLMSSKIRRRVGNILA